MVDLLREISSDVNLLGEIHSKVKYIKKKWSEKLPPNGLTSSYRNVGPKIHWINSINLVKFSSNEYKKINIEDINEVYYKTFIKLQEQELHGEVSLSIFISFGQAYITPPIL